MRGLALLPLFFLVCLQGFLLRPLACTCWRRVQSAALCQLQGFVKRLLFLQARNCKRNFKKINTEPPEGYWAILQLLCSQAQQKIKQEELLKNKHRTSTTDAVQPGNTKLEIYKAGWPCYSCCAARQERNKHRTCAAGPYYSCSSTRK